MRILNIKIKNIQSLKGEQPLIDFENEPFKNTGIFAITGRTGAGKSTILDCITLALYGETPRHTFNKSNKSDMRRSIMSYGTAESFAMVEFEAKNIRYRSKWSIRKARNKVEGKIQAEEMELAIVKDEKDKGKIIAQGLGRGGKSGLPTVPKKIEELIELDFNNFLRSVLLAQGEFVRFLRANANEKGIILEKITGLSDYRTISKRAYERMKREEEVLKNLKLEVNLKDLLAEELRKSYTTRIDTKKELLQSLEGKRKRLETQQNTYENLKVLLAKKEDLAQQIAQNQAVFESKKSAFQALEKFQKIQEKRLDVLLEQSEKNAQNLHSKSQEIQDLQQKEIPKLKLLAEESNTEASRLSLEFEELKAQEEHILVFLEQKILPIQQHIRQTQKDLAKEQNKKETLKKEEQTLSEEIEKNERSLAKQIQFSKDLEAWLEKHQSLENVNLALLQEYFASMNKHLQDFENLSKTLKENEEKWNHLAQIIVQKQGKLEKVTQEGNAKKDLIEKIKQEIAEILGGANVEDLDSEIQHFRNVILPHFKTLIDYAESYENQSAIIKNLEENIAQSQRKIQENQREIEEIQLDLKQEKSNLLIVEEELSIKDFENLRQELKLKKEEQGEAQCPVCGSIHEQPFIDEILEIQASRQKKIDLEKLIQDLENKISEKEIAIIQEKSKSEKDTETLERSQTELSKVQTNFSKLVQEYQYSYEISDLEKLQKGYQTQEDSLKEKDTIFQKIKALEKKLNTQEKERNLLREQYAEVNSELKITQNNYHNLQENLVKIEAEAEKTYFLHFELHQKLDNELVQYKFLEDRETHAEYLQDLEGFAKSYESKLSEKKLLSHTKQKLEISILEKKKQAQQLLPKLEKVQNEIQTYEESIAQNKEAKVVLLQENNLPQTIEVEDYKKVSKEKINQLERLAKQKEEAYQNHKTKLKEQEAILETLAKNLQKLKNDFWKDESNFERKYKETGFVDLAELKEAMLPKEIAQKTKQERSNLSDNLKKLSHKQAENEENIRINQQSFAEDFSENQLHFSLQISEERYKKLTEESIQMASTWQRHQEAMTYNENKESEIKKQEENYRRWRNLSDLIGSAQGDKKFQTFAQGLTMERLVELANLHLLNLNDRYQIRKLEEFNKELELEIVDKQQADNRRPIESLSGGETFLVSLSLALGLSDLSTKSSRVKTIESLFIDEGFGTLDPNTLDTAIDALEKLQSQGKTIGIISHVNMLKERLAVQIQVRKKSGGMSEIVLPDVVG